MGPGNMETKTKRNAREGKGKEGNERETSEMWPSDTDLKQRESSSRGGRAPCTALPRVDSRSHASPGNTLSVIYAMFLTQVTVVLNHGRSSQWIRQSQLFDLRMLSCF